MDHEFDAIKALSTYPDNIAVVSALGEVALNNSDYYLRLEAVKSLTLLKHPTTQSYLIAALHDENAEIRVQAAKALLLLLKNEAISVIIESALKEGISKRE